MGWTFPYDTPTRKSIVEDIMGSYNRPTEGWHILDQRSTCYGRHLWLAIQNPGGSKLVCLFLLQKSDGLWGYKAVDESMGPCYYDCPQSVIDAAGPTESKYAQEWRAEVKIARKRKVPV